MKHDTQEMSIAFRISQRMIQERMLQECDRKRALKNEDEVEMPWSESIWVPQLSSKVSK